MQRSPCFLGRVLIFFAAALVLAPGGEAGAAPARYAEGEILIKYKNHVTPQAQAAGDRLFGARRMETLYGVGVHRLRLPEDMTVEEAVALYGENPDVEYAEPNYVIMIANTPDDPSFGLQWSLHNTGQTITVPGHGSFTGTADADIDAPEAWDIQTGSSGVVVAVIDTGVDYTHPDLAENMWTNPGETDCADGVDNDGNGYVDDCLGWDFIGAPADEDNDPMDDFLQNGGVGHGTHVAGIIGAIGNNAQGVSGITWSVKIMPLKFIDSGGVGLVSDEVEAIQYAIEKGARIINASYGLYQASTPEREAVERARAEGILFVAAAGNDGTNNDTAPFYPASYAVDNIISVTATDGDDGLAWFSNSGPTTVHLGAPGDFIYSAMVGGGYGFQSGTSQSAPMVTGAAALLLSKNPALFYSRLRALLLATVDDKGLPVVTGGRLNAHSALKASASSEGGGGGPCFIATAAYGSRLAPEVKALRDFRDRYLMTNAPGRALVGYYYRVSPPAARYISRHPAMRAAARAVLAPLVFGVRHPLGAVFFALCSAAVLGYYRSSRRKRR